MCQTFHHIVLQVGSAASRTAIRGRTQCLAAGACGDCRCAELHIGSGTLDLRAAHCCLFAALLVACQSPCILVAASNGAWDVRQLKAVSNSCAASRRLWTEVLLKLCAGNIRSITMKFLEHALDKGCGMGDLDCLRAACIPVLQVSMWTGRMLVQRGASAHDLSKDLVQYQSKQATRL